METIAIIILVVCICIFAATGVVTLLAIVGKGSQERPILRIEEKYRSKLFNVLLIEVIGIIISVAHIQVNKYREGIEKRLDKLMGEQTLDLELPRLHEPSGLTHTGITNNGNTIVMAVDDEQHGIFLLEGTPSSIETCSPIRFKFEGSEGKDPDDLEAACFDGLNYFAVTSHRRLGSDHKPVRRLLKFSIDEGWQNKNFAIPVEADNLRDLSTQLGDFLEEQGLPISEELWKDKKKDQRQPYALEIEGLACWGKSLFLGLKWPLHDGKAVLVEYNWGDGKFKGGLTLLDLGGKGITALTFDAAHALLYIGANPPEKVYEGEKAEVTEKFWGNSDVYVFKWNPTERKDLDLVAIFSQFSRRGAKLEGIALAGDELWLAYDGERPAVIRKPLSPILQSIKSHLSP